MIEAGVVFCSAAGTGMSYLNPHSDYLYWQAQSHKTLLTL